MRKLQYRFLVLLSILAWAVSKKTKQKEVLSTENSFNVLTKNSDSLTIDLVALLKEGKLTNTIIVTVDEDPVYHDRKRYNAIPLMNYLAPTENKEIAD
jgi:archaellum biogenesis ATPase FlaH